MMMRLDQSVVTVNGCAPSNDVVQRRILPVGSHRRMSAHDPEPSRYLFN